MKRALAMALAMILCLGLLAGCGGQDSGNGGGQPAAEYRHDPGGGQRSQAGGQTERIFCPLP